MTIWGIMPNIADSQNVKPAAKSNTGSAAHTGPSFAENLSQLAKSANIQVADGNSAALLNLNKKKEEKLEKLFSFTEAEAEMAEDCVDRIKQLLSDLNKK
ncbi:MAG: hypothetical protein WC529_08055 [Candidatus Margulisiibacteriota bacterium]